MVVVKRRLFNVAAFVSLLLCVAMAGLWVRSYWRTYVIRLHRLGPTPTGFWAQHCSITSVQGSLLVLVYL